ncbi:MAG: sprT domain-containing protein [Acidocella sp. 21-58-7]|nr:MAG: sprT domain-containing protein [Acidocella sp. 21-58-7]HQT65794.1 SprT-like domain-containing protein [Acidocella sp.]
MHSLNPTSKNYDEFTQAYNHFNETLFENRLPPCLITLQRKAKAYGYFAGGRFGARDGREITDEIAMNPSHFKDRSVAEILSTLVHEMTHLAQHHEGKPSRTGYHNKEWANLMKAVGLVPSDTGAPGGKEIGQRVSHYVEPGGRFDRSCKALLDTGFSLGYVELWDESATNTRRKKAASKTKFTCPTCEANAWAKPDAKLICGECHEPMKAETAEEEEEG